MESSPLFRDEALRFRSDRLHGNVGIVTPLAWQIIGFLLLGALIAGLGFLGFASYARTETVSGHVALDTGVATILPSRAGIVAMISVREGQPVEAGDPLVQIRSEEDMLSGDTAPERMRASLAAQDESLKKQIELLLAAADAERARLDAQISGLAGEVESLDAQIADQEQLVATSAAEVASIKSIAANGVISRRQAEERQAALILRRQQLAQLEQERSAKQAAIAEAKRGIAQAGATAQAQIANVNSNRAALVQRLAEVELLKGYTITSPVDGVVTALTARAGQRATAEEPMMLVVPAGAQPRVELLVPTAAAGFLAAGQEVRVAIDAFPYQRFGTVSARLTEVSSAAMTTRTEQGPVAVYLVIATLREPFVRAFGRNQPLLPGMTLSARIVTDRRSLLQWLFEPVFAVRNR